MSLGRFSLKLGIFKRPIQKHQKLGRIEYDGQVWNGSFIFQGKAINFSIDGNRHGDISPEGLLVFEELKQRLESVLKESTQYLKRELPNDLTNSNFHIDSEQVISSLDLSRILIRSDYRLKSLRVIEDYCIGFESPCGLSVYTSIKNHSPISYELYD